MILCKQLILPLPPGVNASYKTGKGRFYGSRELQSFKDEAHSALLAQRDHIDWEIIQSLQNAKRKTPLTACIDFYYATLWKRDIDGGEKAVIDALFTYLGLNDNLIVEKQTRKWGDREHPRCELSLLIAEGGVTRVIR